jgi:hypothetical protein
MAEIYSMCCIYCFSVYHCCFEVMTLIVPHFQITMN